MSTYTSTEDTKFCETRKLYRQEKLMRTERILSPEEQKLFDTTEGAIAEVCNELKFNGSVPVSEIAKATVTFVLTGDPAEGRFDPLDGSDYEDESVQKVTATIANYLLFKCDDLMEVVRIYHLKNLAGLNPAN